MYGNDSKKHMTTTKRYLPMSLLNTLYVLSMSKVYHPSLFISSSVKEAWKGFSLLIVCETKEDYKEGCLMVWANSIVGLYFKGTCDVISVTMATHKVHKSGL